MAHIMFASLLRLLAPQPPQPTQQQQQQQQQQPQVEIAPPAAVENISCVAVLVRCRHDSPGRGRQACGGVHMPPLLDAVLQTFMVL
jgi:hypothetical protein